MSHQRPYAIDHTEVSVVQLKGKDWQSVLKKGVDILNSQKVKYQLGCGTLLGAYRDGDIIPHDHDIDIDVFGEPDLNAFNGWTLMRTQHWGDKLMSAVFKCEQNLVFDMCIFHDLYGGDWLHLGTAGIVVRPTYSLKNKKIEFGEGKYNIPKETERYLEGRYGNWKTPAKSSNWTDYAGKYFIPMV